MRLPIAGACAALLGTVLGFRSMMSVVSTCRCSKSGIWNWRRVPCRSRSLVIASGVPRNRMYCGVLLVVLPIAIGMRMDLSLLTGAFRCACSGALQGALRGLGLPVERWEFFVGVRV